MYYKEEGLNAKAAVNMMARKETSAFAGNRFL
jgi:hypothetical protein